MSSSGKIIMWSAIGIVLIGGSVGAYLYFVKKDKNGDTKANKQKKDKATSKKPTSKGETSEVKADATKVEPTNSSAQPSSDDTANFYKNMAQGWTIKKGDNNANVQRLQLALIAAGENINGGNATMYYGDQTAKAVSKFFPSHPNSVTQSDVEQIEKIKK